MTNYNSAYTGAQIDAAVALAQAAVPSTRTVNNKALSGNITLSASDVSAQATITASGLLKGDGSGGVSAASAGTDYASASHTHGNIANDGKIGSTADLPVFTTTAGAVTTKSVADALTALGIVDSNSKITPAYASAHIIAVADSKTFALTDAGTLQKCTNSSAATLTIPLNSAVAFPSGTEIEIVQYGAGAVVVAAGDTTLYTKTSGALTVNGQYASAALKKMGTDEWLLTGDLKA